MNAYRSLAGAYDALTLDVPYARIADFTEAVLRSLGKEPKSVLDLACGTGSMSVLLAERGYSVLGADISEEMLTVAQQKAAAMEHNAPYFVCQPMQRLRLPYEVDLVVCLLDSLNYLTNPEDCKKTFSRVFRALAPGGVFLFDVNTPEKLRAMDGQVFLDENDDTFCVWRGEFDEASNICTYGMDIFRRSGGLWERACEEHCEYAYSQEELTQYLLDAGFSQPCIYADREFCAPRAGEQRIWFAATKP